MAGTSRYAIEATTLPAGHFELPAFAGGDPIRAAHDPLVFGAPAIGELEIAAVADCMRSGWIGPGRLVQEFEEEFARFKGAPHAIAVSSGTAALQLAMWGIGLRSGDEVIAPSMTFAPSLHTIGQLGAVPVLADCRRETSCIDPSDVERRITSRTKAILVVHMCGRCCEMQPILEIARRHRLRVIEDCAHAIEAVHEGQPSGLIGDVGCFSFYATKNLTTGDGGMVLTRDERLHRRMRRLSLQGVTAGVWKRFSQGRQSYEVVSAGLRCAMNDIAAAIGIAQLRGLDQRWSRRQRLWGAYLSGLRGLPIELPRAVCARSRHAYHLFTILLEDRVCRSGLREALQAEHIGSGVHYVPAHEQPYFRRKLKTQRTDLPNATSVGQRTLSLPLSPGMTEQDVADVCVALRRIFSYTSTAAGVNC